MEINILFTAFIIKGENYPLLFLKKRKIKLSLYYFFFAFFFGATFFFVTTFFFGTAFFFTGIILLLYWILFFLVECSFSILLMVFYSIYDKIINFFLIFFLIFFLQAEWHFDFVLKWLDYMSLRTKRSDFVGKMDVSFPLLRFPRLARNDNFVWIVFR